jgi:molybdate transport system substrate-binding protein
MKRIQRSLRLIFAVAAVLASPCTSFAQIKVITSGGFAAAYQEILPEFEKTTGITVTTARGASQGSGPNTIGAQLRAGMPADVVIMSKEGLADLIAEKRIIAGTNIDLAETPLGMSVRAGAPKPDISSVEAFKQTLLRAKSVGIQSTTGIYLTTKLFPRLGIASEMSGKIKDAGAPAVASGETEMAILPVSELLHAPGVDFVGTIPAAIQSISVFSAAIVAGSKELDASKRLIAFFTSETAKAAIQNHGMEPPKSR